MSTHAVCLGRNVAPNGAQMYSQLEVPLSTFRRYPKILERVFKLHPRPRSSPISRVLAMLSVFTASALVLALAVHAGPVPAHTITSEVSPYFRASPCLPSIRRRLTELLGTENNIYGACGLLSQDTDLVVGLPLCLYPQLDAVSPLCGQRVIVVNRENGKSVLANVEDASATEGLLRVSQAVWAQLDGQASGLSESGWSLCSS